MRSFFTKKKNIDIIVCLEAMAVFALAVLAVHDTNNATGAGYSLFLKTGTLTRGTWNILIDLVLVISMIVLLLIPKFILKADPGSVALFFLGASAFSFYLRPDRFLAVFDGGSDLTFDERRWAVIGYIPTWIICAGILLLIFFSQKGVMRKVIVICASVSALCVIAGPVSSQFEILMFASGYFITMPFIRALSVDGRESDAVILRLVPGTVMFLCGMWRLIMVLSTYHM